MEDGWRWKVLFAISQGDLHPKKMSFVFVDQPHFPCFAKKLLLFLLILFLLLLLLLTSSEVAESTSSARSYLVLEIKAPDSSNWLWHAILKWHLWKFGGSTHINWFFPSTNCAEGFHLRDAFWREFKGEPRCARKPDDWSLRISLGEIGR